MSALGDTCQEDGECPAPDSDVAVGGQSGCVDEFQGTTYPGGSCFAQGCTVPDGQSVAYGPDTGCGMQALCFASESGGGVCQALCHSVDDCRTGENIDSYTCSILQKAEDGTLTGLCGTACETNEDCSGTTSTGDPISGRCNSKGYCESECDPSVSDEESDCVGSGGTCEESSESGEGGYCVFEDLSGGGE